MPHHQQARVDCPIKWIEIKNRLLINKLDDEIVNNLVNYFPLNLANFKEISIYQSVSSFGIGTTVVLHTTSR